MYDTVSTHGKISMTNSTHFFNKMKFFFSIIISFALIVILRLFSPLLPIPFIKVSSCPITMKVTRYIIQLTAGHFFFMYGYAAWLLPILIITFPLLENNSRLSTRMARILGFFSILFSSSALCAYHNMYYSYFLCGGIIGNIIVKTIASYAPIIHTNTGMIVFFLTSLICFLQKDIITACSFINKTIKFTVIVESFFKYIYAWIAYAFPIIENIYKIKEYEKYSISLLLQSIAESDILENQSLESITPAITLSQIAKIEKGKQTPVIFVGNLEAKRDYSDVRDIVVAYWLATEKCKFGEPYNICSGKSWSIQSVLDLLLSKSYKKDIEIKQDKNRMRPSDVPVLLGDCSEFKKATGWEPKIPFEKTLEDTLNYWREII